MKSRLLTAATLALLSAGAAPVSAQSLTGGWQVTSQGRRGAQTITIDLV